MRYIGHNDLSHELNQALSWASLTGVFWSNGKRIGLRRFVILLDKSGRRVGI